jgi:hypothetical protein
MKVRGVDFGIVTEDCFVCTFRFEEVVERKMGKSLAGGFACSIFASLSEEGD